MNHSIKNSIQVTGILGKDVILTSFGNGNKKAILLLAINEYNNESNEEESTKTVWQKIIAWGRMAEDIAVTTKKGSLLKISVKVNHIKHTNAAGVIKHKTELVMTDYIKLTKRPVSKVEISTF
ncbi:MAG: single-stranded DNA-binding protein [Saprospiraceae bacterium]|nr:single-stranded DNA-binding protein [Saprospiraceae bacterium]